MLYEGNNPIFQTIGVEHMNWRSGIFEVKPRDYSALAFRISGSATIRTQKGDYCIHSNDILYLPQNTQYAAEYTDTEMIVIHFVTAKDDNEPEVYSFQNTDQLYGLFLKAHTLWKNKEPGFRVYTLSLLYMILGVILEKNTRINQPQHFLKAVSYINANYKKADLSFDKICREGAISGTVFRQLFKKYYQKSPIQYITELRLEHARGLISSGASVETAAYESGFSDAKYFARVVKKHFGCTPRDLKTYGK
jgi:AraC-like DNA-binding protein